MTYKPPDYPFDYGDAEQQRLLAKGELLDPLTRRVLETAGLPGQEMNLDSRGWGGKQIPAYG